MSGYTIIDVDTHVTETPDVWTSRVPDTMKDRVPRMDDPDLKFTCVQVSNDRQTEWASAHARGLLPITSMNRPGRHAHP